MYFFGAVNMVQLLAISVVDGLLEGPRRDMKIFVIKIHSRVSCTFSGLKLGRKSMHEMRSRLQDEKRVQEP